MVHLQPRAKRLALADRWYGVFAAVVLVAGFSRAFLYEKGIDFYRHTPFFHIKLGLFVVIGLLSIYPTIRFLRWRPDIRAGRAPVVSEVQYIAISRVLALQMLLLVAMALAASLMAKGIGF